MGSPLLAACLVYTIDGVTADLVAIEWSVNGITLSSEAEGRVQVGPVEQAGEGVFSRTLNVAQLVGSDAGNYSCRASIVSPYVFSDNDASAELEIIVQGGV